MPMLTGTIFNVMRYAVNDGPGIRTTVFFKGCPLTCVWCHNPEGLRRDTDVMYREDRCMHCGTCLDVCPEDALTAGQGTVVRDASACVLCGTCVEACPSGARELMGREVGVDELVAEVIRDRVFFDESGGGVTISGGEPLAQYGFLMELLEGLHTAGVHTAVETTGFAPAAHCSAVGARADLMLFDLKFADPGRHRQFTGVTNERILANLRLLAAGGRPLIVRVPLVPGVNDDDGNIEAIAALTASLGTVRELHLLPFHAGASAKYRALGRSYAMDDVASPGQDRIRYCAQIVEAHGLNVQIGG